MLGCQRGPEAGTLGKSIVLIVLQLSCHPIPHCFSHFFFWPISLDFSSPECFFFFSPDTWAHYPFGPAEQLNSWTAEKLKANWKISMAKLLHEHRVCYGMPAWTSSLPFDGLWLAGLSIQAPESRILEAITRHLQCVRVSEFSCPSLLSLSSCMKLNPFYEQECKRFRSAILNLILN